MDLPGKVKRALDATRYLRAGDTVVVGVSGGPDSVALLHALAQLRMPLGVCVYAAHFNHALRTGSGKDEKFVRCLAKELQIPAICGVWRRSGCKKTSVSEEEARHQRFQFFVHAAQKVNARAVLLAHTRDDLAETVLLNLLRGSGLQGLRGVLTQRTIKGVTFLRPLLGVSKEEVLRYLRRHKRAFRRDPTNTQTIFVRNKIRHKLLPLLAAQYNSNITEVLCNLAETTTADYEFLAGHARQKFARLAKCSRTKRRVEFSVSVLKRQPAALQRMLIRLGIEYLQENMRRLTLKHVQEIHELLVSRPANAVVHLPQGLTARKRGGTLCLERRNT